MVAWSLAFAVLQAADAIITVMNLSLGAEEGNPLMRAALRGGWPVFVVVKMGVAGAALLVLRAAYRRGAGLALGIATAGSGLIVLHNLSVLRRLI